MKRYLAYITPINVNVNGLSIVPCTVVFLTGDLKHRPFTYNISSDYFKYYYYGSTLEVIELNNDLSISSIRDLTKDDADHFGISYCKALTLNLTTGDMLASNDFVYNINQNNFNNYCKGTIRNILERIKKLPEFSLGLYIINGAVIYIELYETPRNTKYAMSSGYLVNDKSLLKHNSEVSECTGNRKLSQVEIDNLITKLVC